MMDAPSLPSRLLSYSCGDVAAAEVSRGEKSATVLDIAY